MCFASDDGVTESPAIPIPRGIWEPKDKGESGFQSTASSRWYMYAHRLCHFQSHPFCTLTSSNLKDSRLGFSKKTVNEVAISVALIFPSSLLGRFNYTHWNNIKKKSVKVLTCNYRGQQRRATGTMRMYTSINYKHLVFQRLNEEGRKELRTVSWEEKL